MHGVMQALDVPTAPALLSLFLARAVLDECLPLASLRELKRTLDLDAERRETRLREVEARRRADSQMMAISDALLMAMGDDSVNSGSVKQTVTTAGETAVSAALALVGSSHGPARVLRAWGGGGAGAIAHSKRAFSLLLKEYLVCGDTAEAEACLRELKVPHFHHELVKKALTYAIEQSFAEEAPGAPMREKDSSSPGSTASSIEHDSCRSVMAPSAPSAAVVAVSSSGVARLVALLVHCVSSGLILSDQLCLGWERLRKTMPDLALDVPAAPAALEALKLALRDVGLEVEPGAEAALVRVRFHIIRNARIENVGQSQSCMVSKLRIIWKQTVSSRAVAMAAH